MQLSSIVSVEQSLRVAMLSRMGMIEEAPAVHKLNSHSDTHLLSHSSGAGRSDRRRPAEVGQAQRTMGLPAGVL